jgi:CO/xanthine dehydrogenase FAD-binding subunit
MINIKNQEAVEWVDEHMLIGSGACLDDVFQIEKCPKILKETLSGYVSWQKRAETKIAKILQSPNLVPQFVASLTVMKCDVVMCDGKTYPVKDVINQHTKIITGDVLGIIVQIGNRKVNSSKVGLSPSDEPIVFAAVSVELAGREIKDASIALTGVDKNCCFFDSVENYLIGKAISKEVIAEASKMVKEKVTPYDDYRGSMEYRKAMAGLMTKRAFEMCMKGVD